MVFRGSHILMAVYTVNIKKTKII